MANYRIKSDLKKIISRYLKGRASKKEEAFLEGYYDLFDREPNALDNLSEGEQQLLKDEMGQRIFAHLQRENQQVGKISKPRYFYSFVAAAAIVLCLLSTYFIYQFQNQVEPPTAHTTMLSDTTENNRSVTLTLADGEKLSVDQINKGTVVQRDGMQIEIAEDGTVVYTIAHGADSDLAKEGKYNTIRTPKGKQSQINLSDGTKVWLNAETSLTYPLSASVKNIQVILDGEAYFEVTRDKERQFIVKAKNTETKVLGTKFNIKAYQNDDFVKTSLLEGSVSLTNGAEHRLLVPGRQGIVREERAGIQVVDVDMEEVLAWKNGYFMFNNVDVPTMMNIISRWYDIDVVYKGDVKNEMFIGTVDRFESIEKLLSTIELTGGVRFKLEEDKDGIRRKVIVMP